MNLVIPYLLWLSFPTPFRLSQMKNEKKAAENMIIFLLENNNSIINEKNRNEIVNLETRYFNSLNECINNEIILFNLPNPPKIVKSQKTLSEMIKVQTEKSRLII